MLTIEIQKAGFINKGAELMLRSIVDNIRGHYSDVRFVMETTVDSGEQPYGKLLSLGIYPKAYLNIKNRDFSVLFDSIPEKIIQRFGLITNSNIDILIDAAGFAYSSQWGDEHVEKLLNKIKRMKKNDTVVVMMPQAFGPFASDTIKRLMREVIEKSDLIFVRDSISLKAMNELTANSVNLVKAPDFTNLYQPIIPEYFNSDVHQVCIVPNQRMIDKRSDVSPTTYIKLISKVITHLKVLGRKPFILVHENNDQLLASKILSDGSSVPIIVESDPGLIKGVISQSKALVGSRFHSLVSGLSQGIPTIGTGWSHKYNELFSDYNFSRGLISLDISDNDLYDLLDYICNPSTSAELSEALKLKSNEQKQLSIATWHKVFKLIDDKIASLSP